jgi:hypothetical protein
LPEGNKTQCAVTRGAGLGVVIRAFLFCAAEFQWGLFRFRRKRGVGAFQLIRCFQDTLNSGQHAARESAGTVFARVALVFHAGQRISIDPVMSKKGRRKSWK